MGKHNCFHVHPLSDTKYDQSRNLVFDSFGRLWVVSGQWMAVSHVGLPNLKFSSNLSRRETEAVVVS